MRTVRRAEVRHFASELRLGVWGMRAEILTSLAILWGWASLTSGVVAFFPSHALAIWDLSLGALLISLAGWKFVGTMITAGLYTLTRAKPGAPHA